MHPRWPTRKLDCTHDVVILGAVMCVYPDSKVHGANMGHLGPTGPRWAPCWPHELCYLGTSNDGEASSTFTGVYDISNLLNCALFFHENNFAIRLQAFKCKHKKIIITCTKLLPDWNIVTKIGAKVIFTGIVSYAYKRFVKWLQCFCK